MTTATPALPKSARLKGRELNFVLRNLATLIDNGLPLARSLATLAQERSLRRQAPLLQAVCRQVETGTSFSSALARFPESFPPVLVSQVKVGERAGTLGASLQRIAAQLEKAGQIRSQVIRKLAYPAVVTVAGGLAITFMVLFVIPVFDKTYSEAHIPLPWITRALVAVAHAAGSHGWIVPVLLVGGGLAWKWARRTPELATRIDAGVLRLPVLGAWLRDIVVLQFIEVLGNLLESGFNVVDALAIAGESVSNRAVRRTIESLRAAMTRGERFSRELDRLGELFPPVVSQLVVVGEQTGNLTKATSGIREHLHREIEHQTNLLVGTIEPVLTIGLAGMIAVILLAVYLPMFDMIGAMNAH
jgi:type IV pilus assembly protein PilC